MIDATTANVLTSLLIQFKSVLEPATSVILPYARNTLFILIAIDLAIVYAMALIKEEDAGYKPLLANSLKYGAFIFLVISYHDIVTVIMESFAMIGLKAGGNAFSVKDLSNPSKIAFHGLELTKLVWENVTIKELYNPFSTIMLLFAVIAIIVAFFVIGLQVFVTTIEFGIIAALGLILVPFGVFKPTAFIFEKIKDGIINYGIKYMVLSFVVSVSFAMMSKWTPLAQTADFADTSMMAFGACALAYLCYHAPSIASTLGSGGGGSLGGMAMIGGIAAGAGTIKRGTAQTAETGVKAGKFAGKVLAAGYAAEQYIESKMRRPASEAVATTATPDIDDPGPKPTGGGSGGNGGGGTPSPRTLSGVNTGTPAQASGPDYTSPATATAAATAAAAGTTAAQKATATTYTDSTAPAGQAQAQTQQQPPPLPQQPQPAPAGQGQGTKPSPATAAAAAAAAAGTTAAQKATATTYTDPAPAEQGQRQAAAPRPLSGVDTTQPQAGWNNYNTSSNLNTSTYTDPAPAGQAQAAQQPAAQQQPQQQYRQQAARTATGSVQQAPASLNTSTYTDPAPAGQAQAAQQPAAQQQPQPQQQQARHQSPAATNPAAANTSQMHPHNTINSAANQSAAKATTKAISNNYERGLDGYK